LGCYDKGRKLLKCVHHSPIIVLSSILPEPIDFILFERVHQIDVVVSRVSHLGVKLTSCSHVDRYYHVYFVHLYYNIEIGIVFIY